MNTVSILGAGNMARGIATRVLAGGNSVQILARDPQESASLANELGGPASSAAIGDALTGDVVVLAVPYAAAGPLIKQYGDQLSGKIVVDITNPIDVETFDRLVTPADSSAAQEIAKVTPAGAQVVKAFNTTFAGTLGDGRVAGQPLDVFIASDHEDAKQIVSRIVTDAGLRPVDAGPLARAHELEALGYLHMVLQQPLGTAFSTAVKVLP
jgi:8-hydroxy-5-deazaflavin:NADPH oxidoreductase